MSDSPQNLPGGSPQVGGGGGDNCITPPLPVPNASGRPMYQVAVALCRAVAWGYFASLRLEVLALTRHPEDWSIRARWRLTGLPLHLCLLRFYRRDKRHLLRSAPSQHPFVTPPPPGSFSSHWSGSLDHPVCCPCQSVTLLLSPLSPCPCHPTARQPFLTTDLCPLCRCVPVTPCPHIPVPPQGGMPAHVPVTPGEGECQPRVPMSPMSLHPCHPPRVGFQLHVSYVPCVLIDPQGGTPAPCPPHPTSLPLSGVVGYKPHVPVSPWPCRSPGRNASPVSPVSPHHCPSPGWDASPVSLVSPMSSHPPLTPSPNPPGPTTPSPPSSSTRRGSSAATAWTR